MKKKIILLIVFLLAIAGGVLAYNKTEILEYFKIEKELKNQEMLEQSKIEKGLSYQETIDNLDNPAYAGLNEYCRIDYEKPKLTEKKVKDGLEGEVYNILNYNLDIINVKGSNLKVHPVLYAKNQEVMLKLWGYNYSIIPGTPSSGDSFVDLNASGVRDSFGRIINVEVPDINNFSQKEKEFIFENYGKFLLYIVVYDEKTQEFHEYIEEYDMAK